MLFSASSVARGKYSRGYMRPARCDSSAVDVGIAGELAEDNIVSVVL